MEIFDINAAVGHWPFQQLAYETPAALEARLKEYGITGALVTNTHGLFYRDVQNANRELAQWIEGNPFFVGCASINPAYPQWEKDLHTCVEQFGFRAVRLTPLYHGYDAEGDAMNAALDVAASLEIPVLIPQRIMDPRQRHHLDANGIILPETVFSLAERHPDCNIVCTETLIVDDDLSRIAPLANLFVESSRQFTGFSGMFGRLIDAIGAKRILFGTGAPFKEVLPSLIKMNEAGLQPEQLQKILVDNSIELLKRKQN